MTTSERTASVVSDLEQITEDVRSSFAGLSGKQLNWKQDEKSWSIAQCLDHLIKVDSMYFPIFESMRAGARPNSFLEKYSPLSGFFGRYLITAMMAENPKKMKTSRNAYPSSSDLGADIVDRFGKNNRELADRIRAISPDVDLASIITSPLAGFVTYSLDDCLTMLVVHEQRHVLQAKRTVDALRQL